MRFFFYGTLIAGSGNAMARLVEARLHAIGPGTIEGLLHAIPDPGGWYPALLMGSGTVHGQLYEAGDAFAADDLARLDAYEDCDPAQPAASLYRRETLRVRLAGTVADAQTYVFNQPLPTGARPIAGGDFRGWLQREGCEPFR